MIELDLRSPAPADRPGFEPTQRLDRGYRRVESDKRFAAPVITAMAPLVTPKSKNMVGYDIEVTCHPNGDARRRFTYRVPQTKHAGLSKGGKVGCESLPITSIDWYGDSLAVVVVEQQTVRRFWGLWEQKLLPTVYIVRAIF